jgi:hypothetical protein
MLTRTLCGGRVSLAVGLLATLVASCIGVTYGLISGLAGGRIDAAMMRIVDILYAFPFINFVILLMIVFDRQFWLIFVAIGAVEWLTMARVVRGQVLSLKKRPVNPPAGTTAARHVSRARYARRARALGLTRLVCAEAACASARGAPPGRSRLPVTARAESYRRPWYAPRRWLRARVWLRPEVVPSSCPRGFARASQVSQERLRVGVDVVRAALTSARRRQHTDAGNRWTTDAELEALASQFGTVEQVKFFEDKVNGKSKVRRPPASPRRPQLTPAARATHSSSSPPLKLRLLARRVTRRWLTEGAGLI